MIPCEHGYRKKKEIQLKINIMIKQMLNKSYVIEREYNLKYNSINKR